MAYTLIEQETRDLDIFFKDDCKFIHIASGGGKLPVILSENDIQNEMFSTEIIENEEVYEIEVNPNLLDFVNIPENGLERYLQDFKSMAKRGFFSYDKTNLGEFEDPFFHLVAKPIKTGNQIVIKNSDNLLKIENELPTDYMPFNLFEYTDNK